MHMHFWFSPNLGDFLVNGFIVETTGAFVATCVGLGAMAIFLEILKFWRAKARQKSTASHMQATQNGGSETSALLSESQLKGKIGRITRVTGEVVLYFTQESFNWIVMLAVMGYNGYIFLSVLAGAGLGYAIFGESLARTKIQSVKMKAGLISCGECQVRGETDFDALGESDPPMGSQAIPTASGSVSPTITVHRYNASSEST